MVGRGLLVCQRQPANVLKLPSQRSHFAVIPFSFACHFTLNCVSFGSQLQPLVEPHPSHT